MCQAHTCEGLVCTGYLYTVTQRGVLYALQHKAVAQAVWKPEKYKETSHTTCCHYDNQAESFSLISCHSTQHRNPIAFKSYATQPLNRSARLFNTFENKIHRHICGFLWVFLQLCYFGGHWGNQVTPVFVPYSAPASKTMQTHMLYSANNLTKIIPQFDVSNICNFVPGNLPILWFLILSTKVDSSGYFCSWFVHCFGGSLDICISEYPIPKCENSLALFSIHPYWTHTTFPVIVCRCVPGNNLILSISLLVCQSVYCAFINLCEW